MSLWIRRLSQALSLCVLAALSACASERAPINRVEADALAKDFFVASVTDPNDNPEFYWRNFVVDGTEAQSLVGIGSWSGVDRIRWEITENMLFARKAYSVAPGADDKGLPGQRPSGAIVAAYPILKHFDIQRSYNSSTGEELNVIEENSSDRLWNERKYFRVDWSINLVETPQWYDMFVGSMFGEIQVTPLTYYVNDPGHPDAPHFDANAGYFDITSKFVIKPDSMSFSDGTKAPVCMLVGLFTGSATNNCDPQEATVRSSYLRVDKVDPNNDFEPFENTRASLEVVANPGGIGASDSVGIVTAPRVQWDPQYGFTDASMRRFMHVHNIWQKSHQTRGTCSADADCGGGGSVCLSSRECSVPCSYTARGDANNNGTDDQCESTATRYSGSEGSQCSSRNRCTIPYRDRVVKPIGYWMNKETPAALTDDVDSAGNRLNVGPTEDIGNTWNQVLRQSVAKAREIECRRTNSGDRATCHAKYFEPGAIDMVSFGGWGIEKVKADAEDVLVTCHNPVRTYDNKLCGEPGYSARVGDLRHNFLFYWPYSSRAPWGGIANWNADPLTGEIIGAAATTMGRSATFAAAFTRDNIMVANGELSVSDITNGTPAYRYQKQLQGGRTPKTYTKEELAQMVGSVDAANAAKQLHPHAVGTLKDNLPNYFKMLHATKVAPTVTSQTLQFDAIANKLRGSQAEAQIVDKNWLVDSISMTHTNEDVLELASPLRGLEQGRVRALQDNILAGAEKRGLCYFEPFIGTVGNADVTGVARFFKEKYSDAKLSAQFPGDSGNPTALSKRRAEAIYNDLWKDSYKGIALHEVGHSLGMLHEFASSYDSTNFNPQYWQLRTGEGKATASCEGNPRTGDVMDPKKDSCMGPRYLDPENADELGQAEESRPGINYFGNTSTMEYQNERFFESVGLGQFDEHTMNVLYGRVVQTFDGDAPDGLPLADQKTFAVRNWSHLTDYALANWESALTSGVQPMHYTEAARRMKLFDPSRCRDATAEEKAHAEWRIVHGKVCAPAPRDHATWDDMRDGFSAGNDYLATKLNVRTDAKTAPGAIRWPYRWGTTSNSYLHTNPSDAGADVYEVTMETIRKFDYSYPFRYFRRGNRDWYYPGIPSRTINDFYERLRSYHWGIANNNAYFRSFGDADYQAIAGSDDWWRPYIIAEREMFDNITRALLMPEIGGYTRVTQKSAYGDVFLGSLKDIYLPGASEAQATFILDASSGRYISPSFNDGPGGGGSWEYQNWLNWVGFSVEKSEAGRALTDGRAVFQTNSNQNYLDGRGLSVSFRTDMPEAVDRLIGGLLSSDWDTIAPYVTINLADQHPELKMTELSGTAPKRPTGTGLVYPNVGYQQQISTLIYTHLFSRLDTDLTLANKMRIWIDGYLGEFNIPADQQIRFTNPESGLTYIARKYGPDEIDGKVVDKGVASRMLDRANQLLLLTYQVKRDGQGAPILDQFGQPEVLRGTSGEPLEVTSGSLLADYRLYVGVLDASVQISNLVGFGPFNF
ncbi:MAG: hypothetical protein SFV15_10045 [Polyangiaceae bacterium]|nr:hypothetical protein [Polyangiaceae bacterium]